MVVIYLILFLYCILFYFWFFCCWAQGPRIRPIGPFSLAQIRPNAAQAYLLAHFSCTGLGQLWPSPCVKPMKSASKEGPAPAHSLFLTIVHALAFSLLHANSFASTSHLQVPPCGPEALAVCLPHALPVTCMTPFIPHEACSSGQPPHTNVLASHVCRCYSTEPACYSLLPHIPMPQLTCPVRSSSPDSPASSWPITSFVRLPATHQLSACYLLSAWPLLHAHAIHSQATCQLDDRTSTYACLSQQPMLSTVDPCRNTAPTHLPWTAQLLPHAPMLSIVASPPYA